MGPETGTHMKEKYGSDFELVDTEMYDYLKGNCSHLELSQRKEEYIIAQSKDRDRLEYEMIKLEDERDS